MESSSASDLVLTAGISIALLVPAVVTGDGPLWLGWAVVTVTGSGAALIRENWGREPPSDGI